MRMHSITIWVLPPRERRERILWVIIFTHVGAMYKMMLPPANSGSAPSPLLRPSVFDMAVLPICIGCAFSFLMSCCCTFVRNCFFRYGVEEGRARQYPLPTSSVWNDASPERVWSWLWPVVPESIHARGQAPVLRCAWSDPVLVLGCEPSLRRCSGLATAVHPCSAVPGVPCRFRPASGQIPAPTSRWSAVPPHQSTSRLSDSRS